MRGEEVERGVERERDRQRQRERERLDISKLGVFVDMYVLV